MEWKLERTARPRVRSEAAMLWEDVMRVLAKDMRQRRRQASAQVFDSVTTTYSNFKSNFVKRLWAEIPVASSPIATRWQPSPARDLEAYFSGEEPTTSDLLECAGSLLKMTPEADTLTPQDGVHVLHTKPSILPSEAGRPALFALMGSYKEPLKTLVKGNSEPSSPAPHFCKASHAGDRQGKENGVSKGQKCLNQQFLTQKMFQEANGKMQICEKSQCIWKGCRDGVKDESFHLKRFSDGSHPTCQPEVKIHLPGLRNDYYLNLLDWNSQNLVAVALGSSVYIWNGENHREVEDIDLSLTCNYVSSVSWIKEGTCLAVGTSEGEVQLWDVVTKKRLRSMLGHLSVVGALSWNHCILSSGSRLGRVHHHDVRLAQHHVGTLGHKQAVCALKWSLDGRLLSSGCSDGLLTIWPHDPGANRQGQPLRVISQPTAVKAIDWCPWQSEVLAVGGGMKDGCLHILDIHTGKSIQTPSTHSQICSLIWLPKTMEIATGQGAPQNDVTLWTCPTLSRSGGFFGHTGRVLHLALSPDQTRVMSAAADGTACVWKCHQSPGCT